jgi:hypothetical protein
MGEVTFFPSWPRMYQSIAGTAACPVLRRSVRRQPKHASASCSERTSKPILHLVDEVLAIARDLALTSNPGVHCNPGPN